MLRKTAELLYQVQCYDTFNYLYTSRVFLDIFIFSIQNVLNYRRIILKTKKRNKIKI